MQPRYNVSVYTGFKEPYELHPMMSYSDYVASSRRSRSGAEPRFR